MRRGIGAGDIRRLDDYPRVLNKRLDVIPEGAVYVGRPSKWGNPYSHKSNTLATFKARDRDDAVDKYKAWIEAHPTLRMDLGELRGKDLVCWCAPERCHADVLIRLANRP